MFAKAFVLSSVLCGGVAMAAGPVGPGQDGYAFSPAAPGRGSAPSLVLASADRERGGAMFEQASLREVRGDRGYERDGWRDRDDDGRGGRERRWGDRAGRSGWDRDRDDVRFHGGISVNIGRPPAAPAIVLPARYDVRPYELTLRAVQAGETVIVFAEGSNRTGGYTTKLDIVGRSYGQPQIVLKNLAPSTCEVVSQCVSPFSERGYFTSCEALREIKVCVGGQEVCVRVEQVCALR